MVNLTLAGELGYEGQPDSIISINADNINTIAEVIDAENDVGNSVVTLKNGDTINIVQTIEEANAIINCFRGYSFMM